MCLRGFLPLCPLSHQYPRLCAYPPPIECLGEADNGGGGSGAVDDEGMESQAASCARVGRGMVWESVSPNGVANGSDSVKKRRHCLSAITPLPPSFASSEEARPIVQSPDAQRLSSSFGDAPANFTLPVAVSDPGSAPAAQPPMAGYSNENVMSVSNGTSRTSSSTLMSAFVPVDVARQKQTSPLDSETCAPPAAKRPRHSQLCESADSHTSGGTQVIL